jgi:pimeloyl-ACP methyl ester carboxylesterase
MDNLVVLVHSPLVGPFTWSLVAQHLQAVGFDVLVPTLTDSGNTPPPFWQQHIASMHRALASIPQERPLVLVGHSGSGSLLPVLAQAAQHPVNAYLFVDAGLPHPGQSQLDEMEASVPAFAQELRKSLASGERFPQWSDEDLSEEIPDKRTRQHLLAELQPRPLSFFEEVMPGVPRWSDAPCGYLLFTEGYRHFLEQAQRAGWPSRTFHAGHFHMLVDPVAVAAALIELIKQTPFHLYPP